jgi:hypothetical protein
VPTIITRGAASAQALGFGSSSATANYVEDVFSTYLYTGTGAARTITNEIDLSTKGGLVWMKQRSGAVGPALYDTSRGVGFELASNSTTGSTSVPQGVTSFNTTGFTLGTDSRVNQSSQTLVSWTFRKQAKFFDVVSVVHTTGTATTVDLSSLGVVGFVAIKNITTGTDNWVCWNQASPTRNPALNLTSAGSATLTLTVSGTTATLASTLPSATYILYAWAHNAGGFGLDGTQSVVTTGTFAATTGTVVNLGWEPQFLLLKAYANTSNWWMIDNMRGMYASASNQNLIANSTAAEAVSDQVYVTSTGFINRISDAAIAYTYVAIRRGPMKVPTDATKVFGLNARTGTNANATVTGGQTDDAVLVKNRGSAVASLFSSRLTGTGYLVTSSSAAEVAAGTTILQANPWDVMDGVKVGTTSTITNASSNTFVNYLFRRAPGFFDVVCYIGTGANTTQAHNLAAVPELMLVKSRLAPASWTVYSSALANTEYLQLNTTAARATGAALWNSTTPTSSVFSIGTSSNTNAIAVTFVAYLFATLAGVSKVGTYTGNGTTQTVNCGFTAGARFVLIKRTDDVGEWYVYDTARGMTALTDPYWLTNTSADEVATLGSVTTVSTGFALNSATLAAINVNAGTYIFLAIA